MRGRFGKLGRCLCAVLALLCSASASAADSGNCLPSIRAVFNHDGTAVYVQSSKDLSNVVLKFCDGSTDLKYDNLQGTESTFSGGGKELAGVWVKSGCNSSGDGSGYGEFTGRTCGATPPPTPTPVPTPGAKIKVCHIPDGHTDAAVTIEVDQAAVAAHLAHGDILGYCPVDCQGLAFGQAVVDECGVCGGDNSTCADCAGVPNGGSVLDACGVCAGNGTSCAGCDGVPNSKKVVDACGQCGGDNSSCKDCAGIPNGTAALDACGVCNGQGNTCLDCNGVPNGTSKVDACGICGGPNKDLCIEEHCAGTVDLCGACDGRNACLDCAGIPNGGTKIDCCGVCGGDGTSCVQECKFYNLKKAKHTAVHIIDELSRSVRKYSAGQRSCDPRTSGEVRKRLALVAKLTRQSIALVRDFISDTAKYCATSFCVTSENTSVVKTIRTDLKKLYQLSRESQVAAGKACHARRQARGAARRTTKDSYEVGIKAIGGIPGKQCTN